VAATRVATRHVTSCFMLLMLHADATITIIALPGSHGMFCRPCILFYWLQAKVFPLPDGVLHTQRQSHRSGMDACHAEVRAVQAAGS